jgi:hypothetical protein
MNIIATNVDEWYPHSRQRMLRNRRKDENNKGREGRKFKDKT